MDLAEVVHIGGVMSRLVLYQETQEPALVETIRVRKDDLCMEKKEETVINV